MFPLSTRVLALSLSAASLSLLVASAASAKGTKVDICHIGDGGEVLSLSISINAREAHLRHGDFLPFSFFADDDGDGFGAGSASTGCTVPDGYVENDADCDDSDPAVNPEAEEIPGDGVDNDCDPATPDAVDCPCAQLFLTARTIWEGVIGGTWTPSLLTGGGQRLCQDSIVRTPGFLATDLTWAVQASGPAGFGCYAIVRDDRRDTGGDIVLLLDTLIPYSLDPVLSLAEQESCRNFVAANCVP